MFDFLLMMLRGAFVIFTCIKEPASGKCFNARNFKEKSWNTPFSLWHRRSLRRQYRKGTTKKMRKAAVIFVQK